jgi:NAD-dependent dihydropyrimidine dehydrogenase PreA subunit
VRLYLSADGLDRPLLAVERWIEGDRNARLRLWRADWDFRKIRLRLTKYSSWLLIALATGGAWVFYFADAPTLCMRSRHRAGALRGLCDRRHPDGDDLRLRRLHARTGLHLHVPLAAHPGGDDGRGHDHGRLSRLARRAARGKGKDRENLGDCIDCNACVNVCPVGIDIRDGQQLECITCALCIDACDDIMAKIGKPRGLIDYIALTDEAQRARGQSAALDLEAHLPPAHDHLHLALVGGWHRPDGGAVHPLGYRRDGGAGAQPAIRDAVGRVDPQHL